MKKSSWVSPITKQAFPMMRLFGFPYSGGSAQLFKPWADFLPSTVQLCGIQYPGRGSRFMEAPYTSMEALQTALLSEIKPFLDLPFAFFGHSLGAAIAFELTRSLQKEGISPKILFISGRNAPHLPRKTELLHNQPEAQFRESVRNLGGTSPEVLAHPELMDLVAPLIRADFTISETHCAEIGTGASCPIHAYGGKADPLVDEEGVLGWESHASAGFSSHMFDGEHFFMDTHRELLIKKMILALGL